MGGLTKGRGGTYPSTHPRKSEADNTGVSRMVANPVPATGRAVGTPFLRVQPGWSGVGVGHKWLVRLAKRGGGVWEALPAQAHACSK